MRDKTDELTNRCIYTAQDRYDYKSEDRFIHRRLVLQQDYQYRHVHTDRKQAEEENALSQTGFHNLHATQKGGFTQLTKPPLVPDHLSLFAYVASLTFMPTGDSARLAI